VRGISPHCVVAFIATTVSAFAQSVTDGEYMYEGCRVVVAGPRATDPDAGVAARAGECVGFVAALMAVGPALPICRPEIWSPLEAVTVVTEYLEKYPEVRTGEFADLAIIALRKKWPCPN